MAHNLKGYQVHVDGIVQGVGFRPFVYNLARKNNLRGWVRNTSSGVDIEIVGKIKNLDGFLEVLRNGPPPLARIDAITIKPPESLDYPDFSIIHSQSNTGDFIPISPDVSICPDCQNELFDPTNRRFRYPFINCTNCGPRFSIIRDIPYDRPFTTMEGFEMCSACASEYLDPTDRRYHAQPIACAECGPSVVYSEPEIPLIRGEAAIHSARAALKNGKILAVKGLGGYHLACDATNLSTLDRLRERKLRSDKPFALMVFDLDTIRKFVHVDHEEETLLTSPQHPIVLLRKRNTNSSLAHTAPAQNYLGFMLPYTPLHLLLLEPAPGFPEVLVMTSGNISEEPISYEDEEAAFSLASIADCFLIHDRPIHMRIDDSVFRVVQGQPYPIRRARGYAPEPIKISQNLSQILACGAELKNTFALSRQKYIFLSHHIGDLENLETFDSFKSGIQHYHKLFRIEPEAVAVDLHPDYLSTRYGETAAREKNIPLIRVQHHHAHFAACLADNNIPCDNPAIGLIFDGTGYGTDGHIWGGEVLVGDYRHFERRFHLQEAPLPGGDIAIRRPSKIALAYLHAAGIDWHDEFPPTSQFDSSELNTLKQQLIHNLNCVPTSSMGRLFDAVSSLLGIRHHVTYEGQAAIELESLVDPDENRSYSLGIEDNVITSLNLIPQILEDFRNGVHPGAISARFHNTLADISLEVCNMIRSETGIKQVALSGGVWQNITLLTKTMERLRSAGFVVLTHHQVPANDGGIALGQILIAEASLVE